ncbi:MAG: restriction endonuclease subunit S [Nitrospirae bacterium]|nr:restriction endonuclease subunit S [Nitrospirota bacterium]
MKPYPTYKESGIEWLGEIPEGWRIKKLKHIAKINPSKGYSKYSMNSKELVTFLPMEKVHEDGSFEKDDQKPISELWNGFTYFEEEDVIVAKITPCFENGKGAYLKGLGSKVGFGSTEFHVLRHLPEVSNPKYLYYLSCADNFRNPGAAFMHGAAGQKRIPSEFMEEYKIGYSSYIEQTSIATYLDLKTRQIDTLIAKKQRMIELLKEYSTAVINHAVTKGLNPNVKMKDSGIEWIGEIPKHWEVNRLKFLSNIKTGEKDTVNRDEHGEYPFFVRADTVERINSYSYDGEAVLTAGDGVGVGRVFHYVNGKFDYHQRVYKISDFRDITGKFFFYYMQVNFAKAVMKISAKSTVDSLRLPMFHDFPVVFGLIQEQKAVVSYLEQKTGQIDKQIENENKSIVLLQEYRTALISNAVTGKIDVRDTVNKRNIKNLA